MKNYTITVNGKSYDVSVEEKGASASAPAAAPAPKAPAAPAGNQGSRKILCEAQGKVFKIAAGPGTKVKPGDPIVVLEVMKMETPVVAPVAGTVATIECKEGDPCDTGDLLATMNDD
ncbi:MAG: acetyl-CoA carboxylase biotin carboxyl carrier protein subunit [Lachnospiraceae bacterium]|uniref:Acetyl-CoA carboxylase biotin carboxyl carrier protein subunit n=1 Tax=Candidatus Weimeria bifida TaxID=2599074 RepID=A0A6N7IWA1_9FIRM|nr:acetyl-CoA carboxylase biotin carboxyl carrier protein subunit [Candidatus Weimeria bifida]RRF96094.1 MAG: acetyl-CoA carboxylase biotin carboxyl carrier protein subunit [Lachnospiraceae bacterium]